MMEDLYYSEKLSTYFPTRLDVLLYAHDGRGLGHASRAIGIGMALRRLYPDLRILFVTGASISQSLIDNAALDWIKLPSYASMISQGVSTGVNGPANFYKSVLGKHRSNMLAHIIESFKPKYVLVDHNPMGKRKELLEALRLSQEFDTKWVLGLRAVIGTQKDFWSELYAKTFQQYYSEILWYGDSTVLTTSHIQRIEEHFNCQPKEMGYVSRLFELKMLHPTHKKQFTGLISIPWFSNNSWIFLHTIFNTLRLRPRTEKWVFYLAKDQVEKAAHLFAPLTNCRICPIGEQYGIDMLQAEIAFVYSGYNSLMDVLAANIPAILLRRDMKDQEQEIHIRQLTESCPNHLIEIDDKTAASDTINKAVDSLLTAGSSVPSINITGSANTAEFLASHYHEDQI